MRCSGYVLYWFNINLVEHNTIIFITFNLVRVWVGEGKIFFDVVGHQLVLLKKTNSNAKVGGQDGSERIG